MPMDAFSSTDMKKKKKMQSSRTRLTARVAQKEEKAKAPEYRSQDVSKDGKGAENGGHRKANAETHDRREEPPTPDETGVAKDRG
jgi:hypothetical protein